MPVESDQQPSSPRWYCIGCGASGDGDPAVEPCDCPDSPL